MTNVTAIPAALKRKRAAYEAQSQEPSAPPAGDTVSPPPAQHQPPAQPPPQSRAPATPVEIDETQFSVAPDQGTDGRLSRAVEEASAGGPPANEDDKSLQHKFKTLQGMLKAKGNELDTTKEQLATVTQALAELNRRIERMDAAGSTNATPPKPTTPASFDAELTPEEAQAFQKSLPTIQKIALAAARQALAPLLERVAQLENGTQEIRGEFETTRQMTYQERLRAEIPDLEERMAEPDFELFLARPASQYDPRITVRDVLADAHRTQNVQTIKRVVSEYRKQSEPPPAAQADPALFQRPAGAAPQPVITRPAQRPAMLAWSKRVAAGEQLRRGKLSQAEFAKIKALYDKASAENRVDYNA